MRACPHPSSPSTNSLCQPSTHPPTIKQRVAIHEPTTKCTLNAISSTSIPCSLQPYSRQSLSWDGSFASLRNAPWCNRIQNRCNSSVITSGTSPPLGAFQAASSTSTPCPTQSAKHLHAGTPASCNDQKYLKLQLSPPNNIACTLPIDRPHGTRKLQRYVTLAHPSPHCTLRDLLLSLSLRRTTLSHPIIAQHINPALARSAHLYP